jgi:DNA-binding beta-propeller fold protein YncE
MYTALIKKFRKIYMKFWLSTIFTCALSVPVLVYAAGSSFVTFESGQVRPLAYIPVTGNGSQLLAVNTPDNRVEVFDVRQQLLPVASIPVGMEPVAIAARKPDEVWVVNHLSDSVSIIKNGVNGWNVVQTLQVGDEPNDIVFAGINRNRAFITTANRNVDRPINAKIGNANVWVFDAENPGTQPLTVINMFTQAPRALTVSPDGSKVYAAAFNSSNGTTVIRSKLVAGDLPPPDTNIEGEPAPEVGLIVKQQLDGKWLDAAGRDLSAKVGQLKLTDFDVFTIDAIADPVPSVVNVYPGVGSTLFNMVTNPQNGDVYVSNLDARNEVRFEGPGVFGGSTVRGHVADNRISILRGKRVLHRYINKHIDYTTDPTVPDPVTNDSSLAFPLDMAVSRDGKTLYVSAFGSSKIGIYNTGELLTNTFVPGPENHIEVTGGGPSGVILDEVRKRLYVLTRFDNAISVINLDSRQEIAHVPMYNPEPQSVVDGRPFLYDARLTSTRGDAACASCHIFGDKDELAWDLGNPDDVVKDNPNPFKVEPDPSFDKRFHPMKGPMTTQSMRGMANHGPMHWRGDRTGGANGGDPLDEEAAFKAFNVAFEGLIGRSGPLTDPEMQAFTDFSLQIFYPPNPIRKLDNSLTPSQEKGRDFFFNGAPGANACNNCHVLDPANGFFGSDGNSVAIPGSSQSLKVPHLRNVYTKMGTGESDKVSPLRFKGFGVTSDGAEPTVLSFLRNTRFAFPDDATRQGVVDFVKAMDSNLAPIVAQQTTISATSDAVAQSKLALMIVRSQVVNPRPECDLIAKGNIGAETRGWLLQPPNGFVSDRDGDGPYNLQQLMEIAKTPGQALTFTCVPPGSGQRMGIDRDEDGVLDGDEAVQLAVSGKRS